MRMMLWEETLAGNATWSHVLKRGTSLRLTALTDGANVGAYFLNADQPSERLNLPDTLKAQHIARLTTGSALFSDMGRVLCSITSDTVGWHDPLGGCSDATLVERKYGRLTYQQARNDWHQNALDGLRTELEKYGLGSRDLGMNINFFSKVQVEDSGAMRFVEHASRAGDAVEWRAEMNVLVLLNTCQHPMEPADGGYQVRPVQLTISRVDPPALDDPCRSACPENERGFVLSERYFL